MTNLRPLKIQCDVRGYGVFLMRRQNAQFKKMAEAVLQRDDHRCVYCGFQCHKFQEVVNAEKPYTERRITLSDLVTACPICTACFFIGAREESPEHGARLIYLTEISQVQLNELVRLLFCMMENDSSPYQNYARAIYRSLRQRYQAFESIFGPDSSIPPVFASTLVDAGVSDHPHYPALMKSVRLLPARQHFKACVPVWSETVEKAIWQQRGSNPS